MIKFLWLFFSLLSPFFLKSQHKVLIRVTSFPPGSPLEIFIAGSFNNWNPADPAYRLLKDGNSYSLQLLLKRGNHALKFTTGNWRTVEVDAAGADINNRSLQVESDTTFEFIIERWKTEGNEPVKKHTRSANVSVLDTAFYIPQLKRNRRIWIYLPANYLTGKKYYPVLYMHDGQNLFDGHTAYSGEWGVDETLDALGADCIVVGIDNSSSRMNEYNINDIDRFGKAEGRQYLEFVVKTLKPFVDRKFRTLSSKQTTFMAGSSMGGLITLYAGLYYPDTFGGLGIFSPAFSLAPRVSAQTASLMQRKKRRQQKYFFYGGGAESEMMVKDMLNIFQVVYKYNRGPMKVVIRAEGQHNEARWRLEFPDFYKWMIMATAKP